MNERRRSEDDGDMVRDGECVRTSVLLMDSMQRLTSGQALAGHRPGYVQLTDTQVAMRRLARDGYVQRLQTAWRTPARDAAEPDLGSRPEELREPDDAAARKEASYRSYCRQLAEAWRNPPGRVDPGAALTIEKRRQHYTHEASR